MTKQTLHTVGLSDLQHLANEKPTWPDRGVVDMRLRQNKIAFRIARKHVRQIAVGASNFQGCRMAWQFSNELLAAITKATGETP